jgi:peroxiredoxin
MKIYLRTICFLLALTASVVAQESRGHHYVPLREAQLEIKDFTYPTLDGGQLNLREAAQGKRLVLIHYFAAWCHNSNYDVVTMTKLYDKYRAQGLLVIGVGEYSTRDELRHFVEKHKPIYPICIEGNEKKKDRTGTTHYAYRKQIDDKRLWGTPLNVLIAAEDVLPQGDIVTKRVHIAPGEMIKKDLEDWLDEKLSQK